MSDTFIISDHSSFNQRLVTDLGLRQQNVIDYVESGSHTNLHNWLSECFRQNNIKRLIVPLALSLNNKHTINGLALSMHLRLHFQLPVEKRLTPILLITEADYENIIYNCLSDSEYTSDNLHHLLLTDSFDVSSYDVEEINKKMLNLQTSSDSDYITDVLNHIKITLKEDSGKHSIANAWGCYKLAKAIGFSGEILKFTNISEKIFNLYSKYLICYYDSFDDKTDVLDLPKLANKKILYIDDQSNEGWGVLMAKVCEEAGDSFKVIDPSTYKNHETGLFHDYDGYISECKQQIGKDWDLILIDLRLHPEVEDKDEMLNPKELSGYKLIDAFLTANDGYQIMVITASNKIWNLDAVFKRGVKYYYIKESPDYNYSFKETKARYKRFCKDIEISIERKFLYDIYELIKGIKATNVYDHSFIVESNSFVDIAWNLLKSRQTDLAYLLLFQILEKYASREYDFKNDEIRVDGALIKVIEEIPTPLSWKWLITYDDAIKSFTSATTIITEKKSVQMLAKFSSILYLKFSKNDQELKDFSNLNSIRNDIAHSGPQNFATVPHIIDILKIIKEIRAEI
jgi:hypothetical protein